MDSHGVPTQIPTTVTIAGIEFYRVVYHREADVLYLHVGIRAAWSISTRPPRDTTHATAPTGASSGHDRQRPWLLEEDGEIVLTLPEQKVRAPDLAGVLAYATRP